MEQDNSAKRVGSWSELLIEEKIEVLRAEVRSLIRQLEVSMPKSLLDD